MRAPKSVANVLRYVRDKHYDGTVFYRVVKGFVIQMGSWDANVKGRGVIPRRCRWKPITGCTICAARWRWRVATSPTAPADFFINVADNTALDHKPDDPGNTTGFAVFGQVTSGMDVVDAIDNVPVGDHGPMPGQAPVTPILIKKVSVV